MEVWEVVVSGRGRERRLYNKQPGKPHSIDGENNQGGGGAHDLPDLPFAREVSIEKINTQATLGSVGG